MDDDPDFLPAASAGVRLAATNEPLEFVINLVRVTVDCGESAPIHPDSLQKPPCLFELYNDAEKEGLERICTRYREIAEGAFRYWISVLRWRLRDFRVGRSERIDFASGHGTYLHDEETKHPIWCETAVFVVQGHRRINEEEWFDLERTLCRGEEPPIYFSLLYDAKESMFHSDFRKSLIEIAMASEIFMRQSVLRTLPSDLQTSLVSAIEEMNINQYVTKHFRGLLDEKRTQQFRQLSSELSSLFDKRNKLLHMGNEEPVTRDNCERFIRVVEQLLTIQLLEHMNS